MGEGRERKRTTILAAALNFGAAMPILRKSSTYWLAPWTASVPLPQKDCTEVACYTENPTQSKTQSVRSRVEREIWRRRRCKPVASQKIRQGWSHFNRCTANFCHIFVNYRSAHYRTFRGFQSELAEDLR